MVKPSDLVNSENSITRSDCLKLFDEVKDKHSNEKWIWMMGYCKRKGLPPAQSWAWEEARIAYIRHTLI